MIDAGYRYYRDNIRIKPALIIFKSTFFFILSHRHPSMKYLTVASKLVLLLATTLITGCAPQLLTNPDRTPLATNEGIVFTTFTRPQYEVKREEDIANLLDIILMIRRAGDDHDLVRLRSNGVHLIEENGTVTTKEGWPTQVNARGQLSILSAIKLPAGDYEIVKRMAFLSMPPIEYSNHRLLKPTQKFTVRANEVTYISSIHTFLQFGENGRGLHPSASILMTQDRFDSAYEDLLKVRPEWKNMKAINALSLSTHSEGQEVLIKEKQEKAHALVRKDSTLNKSMQDTPPHRVVRMSAEQLSTHTRHASFATGKTSASVLKQSLGDPVGESRETDGRFVYSYDTPNGIITYVFSADGMLDKQYGYYFW